MTAATHDTGHVACLVDQQNLLRLRVRSMEPADLIPAVRWHLDAFPSGFHAQLGAGFMRAWFAAHMTARSSVSLVAVDHSGTPLGYLLGSVDDVRYRERPLRGGARVLATGLSAFAARPGLWWDFARLRARPYAARAGRRILGVKATSHADSSDGELVYICVDPQRRRRGVGAVLLEAFTAEALRNGTSRLHLLTESDNVNAQRFYARRGWRAIPGPARALDGRALIRMELPLQSQPPCAR